MRLGWVVVVLLLLVVLEASVARKHLTKEALQEKKHATHRRAITQRNLNQYLGNARRGYCGTTHHRSLREPKCGWEATECDDPAIRDEYLDAPEATIRMMYNVLRDDNGKDPLPTNQIVQQEVAKLKRQLKEWFNLNADFKIRYVDSNTLRYSYTYNDCTFSGVGDEECEKGCDLKEFGYDGGDCETPEEVVKGCDKDTLVGNGKCDGACNYKDFDWDGGECCSEDVVLPQCKEPGKKTVYNPALNEPEQFRKAVFEATKQSVPSRPDVSLNLYPNVFMASLLGIATFPNDPTAVRPEGGYLSVVQTLGDQEKETSIHELGHCIGLRHTFAGTTEQVEGEESYCNIDATCIENVNGANRDNVGDFCSDTPAEPKSFECTTFEKLTEDCDGTPFPLGDTHNYMSYQSSCGSDKYFFTAQQTARARCYLDRSPIKAWIGPWSEIDLTAPPSFPPLPTTDSPSPTPSPSPSPAPSGWTCDPKFYGAKDGCDCECGVYDPDCDLITQARVPEIFNCDSGVLPKCDKTTAKCVYRKVVPNEWQCDPMAYDSLDGCDCDCGTFDPDCNVNKTAAELFNCKPGGVCSATGTCQYPVPPTWKCNPLQYNDGITCNCNCGALDTDCDWVETAPPTVGCIGTERCHLNDGTCVAAQERFEFGEGIVQTTVPKLSSYSFVADDSVCESFACDFEPSIATRTNVAFLSSRPGCPGTLVDVFSLDIVDYENGLFKGPSMGTIVATNCDPTLLGNEMLCGLNEVTGLWTPVNTATCTPSVATAAKAATLKTGTCAQFKICQPFKYYGIFRSVGFSIPRIFRAKK